MGESFKLHVSGVLKFTMAPEVKSLPSAERTTPDRRQVDWAAVVSKWNALAAQFGLASLQKAPNAELKKQYVARQNGDKGIWNWWSVLEEELPLRGEFYVQNRQPTFRQATRQSYFEEKIWGQEMRGKDHLGPQELQHKEGGSWT